MEKYTKKYMEWKAKQKPTDKQKQLLEKLVTLCHKNSVRIEPKLLKNLTTAEAYANTINTLFLKLDNANALPAHIKESRRRAKAFNYRITPSERSERHRLRYNDAPKSNQKYTSYWTALHESGELVYLGDRTVKKSVLQSEN